MANAFETALEQAASRVVQETVRITEIPAPTFRERRRAGYVRDRFEAIGGWDQVSLDSMSNVVAVRRGEPGRARILVCAHLDTVFPDEATPVTRGRGRLIGRGVGDNSLGVAAVLGVAEALHATHPRGLGDVLLAANVGEEGRGNLRGVRRLVKDYAADFDALLAIEGHSLNRVQSQGVGSLRYQVSVTTDGGHSWGAYGRPNAIAILSRAIVALDALMPVPGTEPKTTMNVGVISGGRSVNTIAPDATFELDIRSVDPARLQRLSREARAAMRVAVGDADLKIERIGNRPGGPMPSDSTLVRTVVKARSGLGLPKPEFTAGSTDANAALAAGYPTTCIGVTTGSEAHTPREWIHTAPIKQGVPYVGRAVAALARLSPQDMRQGF